MPSPSDRLLEIQKLIERAFYREVDRAFKAKQLAIAIDSLYEKPVRSTKQSKENSKS